MKTNTTENPSEPTMSIRTWLLLVASLCILGIVATCVVLALPTIRLLAPALAWAIMLTLIVAVPGSVIAGAFWIVSSAQNKRIAARKFAANANNVFPAYLDLERGVFIQAVNGSLPNVVPEHYAPAIHNQNNVNELIKLFEYAQSTRVQEIAAPALTRPSQEAIIEQLPYNQYMVSPGAQLSNGEIVAVSLLEVPHVKFIGAPGFGKSCLAGSILDQVTQTNDRQHLQLALLDCEHKTSRLFENNPNIAQVRVGGRVVDLVATDADMVAVQLGFLKREMMRRAQLSEAELDGQPVLLMYVEEMLSLQYEVDPKLLQQMVDDILILAVRARKYRMFLLSCMQTDYSTDEMKVSQKMFRLRGAAAIDPSAARAAGFQNGELIKANFQQGQKGQFVIEYPGFSNVVLVPSYDVKKKLQQLGRSDARGTLVNARGEQIAGNFEDEPDAGIVDADRAENGGYEDLPGNVRTFPQTGINAPGTQPDAASDERPKEYRLTDEEIPRFIAAYKASGNVDKALAAIDHGARFRKHAGELVSALNLRKDA